MLLGVQSPYLVTQRELLCKSDAEGLEVSSAGYFMTQVQEELHLLDGDHQSREWFLSVVVRGWLHRRQHSLS